MVCDLDSKTLLVDVLTGVAPRAWRANDVDLAVLFTRSGTIITDFSNVTKVSLEVHRQREFSTGAVWPAKDILVGDIDETTDQSSWDDATKEHALWELSAADTNLDLTGQSNGERPFWLVITFTLVSPSGGILTAGATNWFIAEDPRALGAPAAATVDTNFRVTTSHKLQFINKDTGHFHDFFFEGSDEAPVPANGPGET